MQEKTGNYERYLVIKNIETNIKINITFNKKTSH